MESQIRLPLFGRLDGASVAPSALVRSCKSYRHAVRCCWAMRRIHGMTKRQLAAEGEFFASHVTDWLHSDDKPSRRSLPAACIARFESLVGNTLVTQWLAAQHGLTVLEEVTATRNAA